MKRCCIREVIEEHLQKWLRASAYELGGVKFSPSFSRLCEDESFHKKYAVLVLLTNVPEKIVLPPHVEFVNGTLCETTVKVNQSMKKALLGLMPTFARASFMCVPKSTRRTRTRHRVDETARRLQKSGA